MLRNAVGAALVLLGTVQLLGVPGYYSVESALAAAAVGVLLLAAGYVVFPWSSVDIA